jgi:hypothetical protein
MTPPQLRLLLAPVFLIACSVAIPTIGFAHPGNTDAYGCHTCWTNCSSWGLSYEEYHCHTPKSLCAIAADDARDSGAGLLSLNVKYGPQASCSLIPQYKRTNETLIKNLTESLDMLQSRGNCGSACIEYECAIGVYKASTELYDKFWAIGCVSSSSSSRTGTFQMKQSSSAPLRLKSSSSKKAKMVWPEKKAKKVKKVQKCTYDSRGTCKCPAKYTQVSSECRLYE